MIFSEIYMKSGRRTPQISKDTVISYFPGYFIYFVLFVLVCTQPKTPKFQKV